MDFKAALVNNLKPFVPVNPPPPRYEADQNNVEGKHVTQSAHTRRRRRRHHKNNYNNNMDNMLQVPTISYKPIPQQALAFKEAVHARATATPQNHEIHEHPVPFPWAPNEKVPLELLQGIANRARERLEYRIQAHYSEQVRVAEVAGAWMQQVTTYLREIDDSHEEQLQRYREEVDRLSRTVETMECRFQEMRDWMWASRTVEQTPVPDSPSMLEEAAMRVMKSLGLGKENPSPVIPATKQSLGSAGAPLSVPKATNRRPLSTGLSSNKQPQKLGNIGLFSGDGMRL